MRSHFKENLEISCQVPFQPLCPRSLILLQAADQVQMEKHKKLRLLKNENSRNQRK